MINGIGKSNRVSRCYLDKAASAVSKIPNVPKMRTKGQCRLSEKELAEKIVKLAESDAAAGKDSQYGSTVRGTDVRTGTAEWIKLREDFISLASPDRMGIVKNTLSRYANQMSFMQLKIKDRFEFFDVLFANNKKFGPNVGGNYVEFKDEEGNVIAEYSTPNGWRTQSTPAESARRSAFYDLWRQALADAQEELETGSEDIPAEETKMSFLA